MDLRNFVLFSFLSTSLLACMQREAQPETGPAAPGPIATDPATPIAPTAASVPAAPSDPFAELPGTTIYHVSLNLVVDNPAAALEETERVLRKLGGEITYGSANGETANLNGRVPVEARHQLRDALVKLAREITQENMSTSDVSHDVRRLRRRLGSLQQSDAMVAAMVAAQSDPPRIEAAALLRELTERERQNIESQLQSYMTQTKDGQVNVSFTKKTD
jgi:hypothetical protein